MTSTDSGLPGGPMRRLRCLITVLAAVAVVIAGCGRGDGKTGSSTGSSTGSTTGSTSASGTAGGGRSAPTGDFGTLTNVCQPGGARGATAQGVTDGSIRIATFSDPGYSGRPGLNQELFDSAEVFAKWCNDAGGINGRKIVVDQRDAALVNYKPRVIESCAQDFLMVGGGAVFDNTGQVDRLSCLLPDIPGFLVTPEARGADLEVQPLPNPTTAIGIGDYRWLGERFRASRQQVGILTGNLPTTITVAKQAREAITSLGWRVVYSDQYPPAGVTDWSPYVQSMKDKGVQGLVWIGEPENLAKLEQAMASANYRPAWIRTDPNHYDKKLIELAGPNVGNTYVTSTFAPFEAAKGNPATQQYLDAFARYKPDAKTKAYLGLQAWSAWLLFAQSARECGANLTRKCVYDNAKTVTEWTGGGLHAPTNPGERIGSRCFLLLRATPNGFVTVDVKPNDGPYNCSAKNGYALKGDYGKGVTLADVGKSVDDLK